MSSYVKLGDVISG